MKIKLSNKFYKKEAIKQAIEAFKNICECRILNDSFEIGLIPKFETKTDIHDEFCNFVLGVTKDNMLF